MYLGSLLTQFAPSGAEAGEKFAAVASAGGRCGSAVVEDRLLLPFEGDATEPGWLTRLAFDRAVRRPVSAHVTEVDV